MFKSLKAEYRPTLTIAIPIIISQIGHTVTMVADNIFVGQLGAVPLAACALASNIFTIALVLGMGVAMAITPLVAQENAKDNKEYCSKILSNGFLMCVIAGFALFGMVYVVALNLDLFGQKPEVIRYASPFLITLAWSTLPLMVYFTFKQFAEGLSFTRQSMYITLGANAINIFLNYVLVFGKFGFDSLGPNGAAIATLISRIFMAVGMMLFVLYSGNFKAYKIENFWRELLNFNASIIKLLSKMGIPIALQYVFEISAFTGASIMIGWISANNLAAHQIAISMAAVTYMAASGIAAASTVRIGDAYGVKNFESIKSIGKANIGITVLFMVFTALIFSIFSAQLPKIYIADVNVIKIASTLLIIAAFFQIFDGIQVTALGALRGINDVQMPTIYTLIAYWVVALPLGYWLCFKLNMGVAGIWYGLTVGLAVSAILLTFRFFSLNKKLREAIS